MSQVMALAKELVKLSLAGEEADPLTNLRLQKLLYYAQAWSIVIRETELFPEEIRAWRYGPVVEELYRELQDGQCAACVAPDAFAKAPDLDPEDAAFVKKFWDAYSRYSACELYRMTHSEPPWRKARGSLPPTANGNDPIPVAFLDEYFGKQELPAPLAEYRHDLRRREEESERKLREIPPIDVDRFKATATSFTPAALKKAARG